MEIKEKIAQILENHLEDGKYFVVDIKVSLSKIHSKVQILLDSDTGISIDECGIISRKLGLELDELMPDKYTLEVSSPGTDFPLKFERMYRKNIGRNLKVIQKEGHETSGKLESVDTNGITILVEKKKKAKEEEPPVVIPFESIKEAKVLISFK